MKTLILLCLLLFLVSATKYSLKPYEIAAHKLIARFSKEMNKEGFTTISAGNGQEDFKNKLIIIRFKIDRVLNIQDARKLCLETTERFLNLINSTPGIEKLLIEYPFKPKHLSVSIHSIRQQDSNFICGVSAYKGNLMYSNYNEQNVYVLVHEETYEDALKIVQSEADNLRP